MFPRSPIGSQKGTLVLRDGNNYNYRIHKKNTDGTKAYYKCLKKDSAKCLAMTILHLASSQILTVMHEHVHEPNILQETACSEEMIMIDAVQWWSEFLQWKFCQRLRLTWSAPKTRGKVQHEEEQGSCHGSEQGEKEGPGT
jgi:hypothetical protein